MIGFSDAHFHSISKQYEGYGVDFDSIYAALFAGIDCSASLGDAEVILGRIARHPNIRTTVGAGPWQSSEAASGSFLDELEKEFARFEENDQVVAVGEVGLDYHYGYDKALQKKLFERQIGLSIQYGLPLILHIRDSFKDVFDMLAGFKLDKQGIVHCFSGSADEARIALDMGFYLSFGGSATYKRNEHIRRALSYCPSDRLLLETDSPYLSPEGKRGMVNTPMNIYDIGNILSEFRPNGKDGGIFMDSNRNISDFFSQKPHNQRA